MLCRNFDKDHIDPNVMKKIQTYTVQPDFQPEKIEKVSYISEHMQNNGWRSAAVVVIVHVASVCPNSLWSNKKKRNS